jgi:hypothetical protein
MRMLWRRKPAFQIALLVERSPMATPSYWRTHQERNQKDHAEHEDSEQRPSYQSRHSLARNPSWHTVRLGGPSLPLGLLHGPATPAYHGPDGMAAQRFAIALNRNTRLKSGMRIKSERGPSWGSTRTRW